VGPNYLTIGASGGPGLHDHCHRAKEWALHRLMTIGEVCRAMLKESLRKTLAWAIEQVTERGRSFDRGVAQLGII
jgi:hypothetical protein